MYQLIGIRSLLHWYAVTVAVVSIGIITILNAEMSDWPRLIIFSATLVGGLLALVGQTSLFPILCRYTALKKIFPYIDGKWAGKIVSNWNVVSMRGTSGSLDPEETTVSVEVTARLFSIDLLLRSLKPYSESSTLSVTVKTAESGCKQLHYIYQNRTKHPAPGDEQVHFGAAILDIRVEPEDATLDGIYWTNRNWQEGLNTAGTIILRRQSLQPGNLVTLEKTRID